MTYRERWTIFVPLTSLLASPVYNSAPARLVYLDPNRVSRSLLATQSTRHRGSLQAQFTRCEFAPLTNPGRANRASIGLHPRRPSLPALQPGRTLAHTFTPSTRWSITSRISSTRIAVSTYTRHRQTRWRKLEILPRIRRSSWRIHLSRPLMPLKRDAQSSLWL